MSDEPNTEATSPSDEFKLRTDDELKRLALDIVDGKVFGSWMTPNQDEGLLPFKIVTMMMDKEHLKELERRQVIGIYEYMSEAGPMSVNGLPSFMSCRMIHRGEADKLNEFINKAREMRAQFLGDEVKPSEG